MWMFVLGFVCGWASIVMLLLAVKFIARKIPTTDYI